MTTENETVTIQGEFTFEYETENLDGEGDTPKQQAKRLAKNSLLENPELLENSLTATVNGDEK